MSERGRDNHVRVILTIMICVSWESHGSGYRLLLSECDEGDVRKVSRAYRSDLEERRLGEGRVFVSYGPFLFPTRW